MKTSALCRKIAEIPGIGPITATAVVAAVGDARQFRNAGHLSAWLGLVPRQYSMAANPACKASADAATHTCGPCSLTALELFCAMHRQKVIRKVSGFKS
jgi:transposase